MLIHSIELYLFKGFRKPGIKKATINFSQKLQVLNSTNGSGKSTFLSELSLFPIEKTLFYKGGYKKIVVGNEKGVFTLISNHQGNSFVDMESGEELNGGGTIKLQMDLIEQYFGLTPFLWGLISGYTKFTSADKNVRRSWMECISGLDFDYALGVYKDIQKAINEHKGAIKINQNHLTNEQVKLLSEDVVNELIKEHDGLTALNKEILRATPDHVKGDVREVLSLVERLEKEVMVKYQATVKFKLPTRPNVVFSSIDDLRVVVNEKKNEIEKIDLSINHNANLLNEKNALREKLLRTDGLDLNHVSATIIDLEKQTIPTCTIVYESAYNALQNVIVDNGIEKTKNQFERIKNKLITLITDNENTQLHYSLEEEKTHKTLIAEIDSLMERVAKGRMVRERILGQLEHVRNCVKAKCPTCSTTFLVGVNPESKGLVELEADLVSVDERIAVLDTEIKKLTEQRNVFDTILSLRTQFKRIFREVEILLPLWVLVDFNLINDTQGMTYWLEEVENYFHEIHRIKLVQDKLVEYRQFKIELTTTNLLLDPMLLGNECQVLTEDIQILNSRRSELFNKIKTISEYGKQLDRKQSLYSELIASVARLEEERLRLLGLLEKSCCDSLVDFSQQRLGLLTHQLNDHRVLSALVLDLQKQITVYRDKLDQLIILEKLLNPTTGIIGEQLVDYTNAFAKQLTGIIGQLWGYPLEILPCQIDGSKGMDYKFPFKVNECSDEDNIPDISLGSKSQVAVFNLGVMLATRVSLGLVNMPLILDEIGEGFDTVHNENLVLFLKQLLSEYQCSNMFIVHHDPHLRATLGQHDVIVFDADHVVIEGEYNRHVLLEYY